MKLAKDIRDMISAHKEMTAVNLVFTLHQGSGNVLAATGLEFVDSHSAADVQGLMRATERN